MKFYAAHPLFGHPKQSNSLSNAVLQSGQKQNGEQHHSQSQEGQKKTGGSRTGRAGGGVLPSDLRCVQCTFGCSRCRRSVSSIPRRGKYCLSSAYNRRVSMIKESKLQPQLHSIVMVLDLHLYIHTVYYTEDLMPTLFTHFDMQFSSILQDLLMSIWLKRGISGALHSGTAPTTRPGY